MSTLALGVWASASYPHVPCECPALTGLWMTPTWVSSALRHPIARISALSEAKPSAFTLNPTFTPAHPAFPQPHSISVKLTQGTSPIFHSKGNIKAHVPSNCLPLSLPLEPIVCIGWGLLPFPSFLAQYSLVCLHYSYK